MKACPLRISRPRSIVTLGLAVWSALLFAVTVYGDIRVACVGDSITAGSGVRDRALSSYPAQLARWLGGVYDVRNFGVSGATMLAQGDRPYVQQRAYTDALAFRPDVVVIALGTNDSKRPRREGEKVADNWGFKASYAGDYEAMVAAFRQANPTAKIYVCLPPPAFPGRWGIGDVTIRDEVIPLVRDVAAKTAAEVIDFNAALAGRAELFPDTVHPNEEGAKLIAAAVHRALTGQEPPPVESPLVNFFANRRVLWLGDSITQDGRYISYIEYYLAKTFPARTFDFVGVGLASETVSGLSENAHPFPRPCVFDRLQAALTATGPATVVACYGMNDGIYHPKSEERLRAFQDGVRRLAGAAQAAGAEFVLITPPPFDAQAVEEKTQPETAEDFSYRAPFRGYDAVLREFAAWEQTLGVSEARVIVDVHSAIAAATAERRRRDTAFTFAKDGIHPASLGHLLMAHVFLRTIGVEIGAEAGELEAELARVEADPLFQLVRERREKRSAGWLSFIGYNRGKLVKSESVSAVEAEAGALQKQIDALRGH
jgi:lysophospholipase L1-like esterase